MLARGVDQPLDTFQGGNYPSNLPPLPRLPCRIGTDAHNEVLQRLQTGPQRIGCYGQPGEPPGLNPPPLTSESLCTVPNQMMPNRRCYSSNKCAPSPKVETVLKNWVGTPTIVSICCVDHTADLLSPRCFPPRRGLPWAGGQRHALHTTVPGTIPLLPTFPEGVAFSAKQSSPALTHAQTMQETPMFRDLLLCSFLCFLAMHISSSDANWSWWEIYTLPVW